MRKLTNHEIDTVAGGLSVGPAQVMRPGVTLPVALVAASFYVGYGIGTAIYNAWTLFRY